MRSGRAFAVLPLALSLCVAVWSGSALAAASDPLKPVPLKSAPLKIVGSIKGADGGWDYASVDSTGHRLYVARGDGVMAVNLDDQSVTPTLVAGGRVHGVLPLGGGLAISTNGDSSSAILFRTADGAVVAEFAAGKKPDAVVRDSKSGLVAVMNGKDGTVTLIDIDKKTVVGSIAVGGTLEFAAADGEGHVFVNVEDKNELVTMDIPSRRVLARIPLKDCDGPTGLALDAARHVLVSACGNGKAVAISAIDGHFLAGLPIGGHPDAVIFDAANSRFLVPCGGDGTLSVISEAGDGVLSAADPVATEVGARTGAIDAATGKVYLPTAAFLPAKPGERRAVVPGSFHILVLGPS